MKKNLLFFLVIGPLFTFSQLTPKSVITSEDTIGFYEFKPQGYNPDSTYEYPVIIFLHGVGERGNGTSELPMALLASFPKLLVKGATMKFIVNGRKHAFLVLLPQMSKEYENWQAFYVDAMINYAIKNLKADVNKIFLTGWSLGGGGAWKYPTTSIGNAKRIAGIVPVSPAPDYTNLCYLAHGKVAVWAHHARDDASVPLHFTKDAINGINGCAPDIPAIITYYSAGGHPYVADHAYDTLNKLQYPNVYQWMVGTSRNNSIETNKAPLPMAGSDTTIIVPSVKTVLNGSASYDPNDVIVKYRWTVVTGPLSPQLYIQKPDFPVTNVSGLEPGNYTFRLTVKDQFGIIKYDNVNVAVTLPLNGKNASPLVEVGPAVELSADNYRAYGKVRDYDGKIQNHHWRQISGPVSILIREYGEVADLIGLTAPGTYRIELSAFDDNKPADVGKDTLFLVKKTIAPIDIFYWSNGYKNNRLIKRNAELSVFIFNRISDCIDSDPSDFFYFVSFVGLLILITIAKSTFNHHLIAIIRLEPEAYPVIIAPFYKFK